MERFATSPSTPRASISAYTKNACGRRGQAPKATVSPRRRRAVRPNGLTVLVMDHAIIGMVISALPLVLGTFYFNKPLILPACHLPEAKEHSRPGRAPPQQYKATWRRGRVSTPGLGTIFSPRIKAARCLSGISHHLRCCGPSSVRFQTPCLEGQTPLSPSSDWPIRKIRRQTGRTQGDNSRRPSVLSDGCLNIQGR